MVVTMVLVVHIEEKEKIVSQIFEKGVVETVVVDQEKMVAAAATTATTATEILKEVPTQCECYKK